MYHESAALMLLAAEKTAVTAKQNWAGLLAEAGMQM